jgi:hypothetical protein
MRSAPRVADPALVEAAPVTAAVASEGQEAVHMSVTQAWVAVGVPGLLLAMGLFVGHDKRRAWIGYGVLAALTGTFFVIPGGGPSAAVVGLVGALIVAMGRGTGTDDVGAEHHEERRRFTTARESSEHAPSP